MEDVMYGLIPNAKMDMLAREPPVNASRRLNASPVCAASQFAKNVRFTPGTGS